MPEPLYIPGDHWVICDCCGFKIRSSAARKRWDGLLVCQADWEPRHPQDFVRGQVDRQKVEDPRPEPVQVFIGPLLTTLGADAAAGATSLTVESSTRFGASDLIGIMLDNGDIYRATVATVPDATSLTITAGLSGTAASGNTVINYSAIAEADVG